MRIANKNNSQVYEYNGLRVTYFTDYSQNHA